jgi:hypothetical protein
MTNYSITKRDGSLVEFDTDLTVDGAALAIKDDLTARRQAGRRTSDFASDLLVAYEEGRLSRKQSLWLLKLGADLEAPAPAPSGELLSLVTAIHRQQAASKARVILRLEAATLKAVTEGANAGGVYVFAGDSYAGKITSDGALIGDRSLLPALEAAAADPVAAARSYGNATGRCGCCGRLLSDPVSIYGGIGPICLERMAGAEARKELEAAFAETQRLLA